MARNNNNNSDDNSINSVISDISSMSLQDKKSLPPPLSFYIARAETNQTQESIRTIIEQNHIGQVRSVQLIPRTNDKNQSYYSVIVQLFSWNHCPNSVSIQSAIAKDSVYKFYYNRNSYWNISKNHKDTGFINTLEKFGIKPVNIIPENKYNPTTIHYNAETNMTFGYKPQGKQYEGQEIIEIQQQTIEDLKTQLKEVTHELYKFELSTVNNLNQLSEENQNMTVYKWSAEEWKAKYDDLLNAVIRQDYKYIWDRHVPASVEMPDSLGFH